MFSIPAPSPHHPRRDPGPCAVVAAFGALLLLTTVIAVGALHAPAYASDPVATFSIVGYDPETGDLGIVVQSKFFAVGAVVPWARAGVGAIATQAFANTTFGPEGLSLLEAGHAPQETIDLLLSKDADRDRRQVGIVDAHGVSASYTGTKCQAWAGGKTGDHFSAQGNILVSQATVDALARGFTETRGTLGQKLMAALEQGQAAGGDSRGMQSAAILIVRKGGGYGGFNDRYCDLRVDDNPEPIKELRRIFDMWQGQALIMEGYNLAEKKEWDKAFAIGEQAIRVHPDQGEPYYHLACFYSKAGRKTESLARLVEAVKRDAALAPRAKTDTDFEPMWKDADFLKVVEAH